MNALLDAAHSYRRRGWRVIALHSVGPDGKTCSCHRGGNCGRNAGKHPINNAWQNTPPMSGPDIESIWEDRPKANVGLATGTPSGFFVLDIDPGNGGFETMRQLVETHGPLPQTIAVETGSGGWHYYFEMPDFEVSNSQDRVGKGIDVRGTGGQVVAPPSRSGKGVYTLGGVDSLASAPEWLLELVRKKDAPEEITTAEDLPRPEDIEPAEWARLNRYAESAINAERERLSRLQTTGWDGEPWNATTFEVSCALIEFANSTWCSYSLGHARADVLKLAPRDTEGFDTYTVTKTFESARDKVGKKARPVPPKPPGRDDGGYDPLFGPPDPTEGGEGPAHPRRQWFGGDKGKEPLYANMADSVFDGGPIGWGHDNDFWSYDHGVWFPDHYVVQHRLVDMLGNDYRTGHRTNVLDIVQRHAQRITGDPLEPLMNFGNGMLEWRTGQLVDHDPSLGSTVQFGCDWDPEATCPRFEEFLADVMHADYVALAWEMIGYLMLSGNPLQVAFLLYGSGGNGKGTLIRVIEALLGKPNISSETLDDLNNNRFRTAELFGKIANLAGDIDATYQEHTAMFKKITGEDEVSAERKNMAPFKFESWAVPVFSANKIPGSADVTPGYLRRWIVLHFHKTITNIVPGLSKALELELAGIARKGVDALRVLMERDHFEPYGEAIKGKQEFAEAIDQVRRFLSGNGALQSPGTLSPLSDLYAAYSLWAERGGQRKVAEQEFSQRLSNLGYEKVDGEGRIHHRGLIAPPTLGVKTGAGLFD